MKPFIGIVSIMSAIAILGMEFRDSPPPLITSVIRLPGCNIKGNISIKTGKKLYHLPGMEDYATTLIDPLRGERWFCTEAEAIKNGWRKAPR